MVFYKVILGKLHRPLWGLFSEHVGCTVLRERDELKEADLKNSTKAIYIVRKGWKKPKLEIR